MKENLNNIFYLWFLLSIDGLGPHKVLNLISSFPTLSKLQNSTSSSLNKIPGINTNLSNRIRNSLKDIILLEKEFDNETKRLDEISARRICFFDEEYPSLLKNIYSPPLILYIMGKLNNEDNNSIAVVGTRNPSQYGKNTAEKITKQLVNRGITIVSGLARGIDSISHRVALLSSGRTIAITGSGLDVVYPPENRKLYAQIIKNGAVITEFPPGTKPDAKNFPRRNRIISGLSLGTVVIESKEKGGAIQTARFSLDQNREVFAVPGNIDNEKSYGPNKLIQNGEAKLINKADDIIEEIHQLKPVSKNLRQKPVTIQLSLFEQKILNELAEKDMQIDILSDKTKMNTSECLIHLLNLELNGLVRQLPGKVFTRINN